jgi:hypothetical protein
MRAQLIAAGGLALLGLFAGCETPPPPGVERGPHGTIAYDVLVESSEPGVRIEANHEYVGTTPLTLKIFGDKDGTFHDFGSYYYIVEAFPLHTNQFVQTRVFRTGHLLTPEDNIPRKIFFDMNQPPANYGPQVYGSPGYPPPPPYYYGDPGYYYGPSIYIGPGFRYRRRW